MFFFPMWKKSFCQKAHLIASHLIVPFRIEIVDYVRTYKWCCIVKNYAFSLLSLVPSLLPFLPFFPSVLSWTRCSFPLRALSLLPFLSMFSLRISSSFFPHISFFHLLAHGSENYYTLSNNNNKKPSPVVSIWHIQRKERNWQMTLQITIELESVSWFSFRMMDIGQSLMNNYERWNYVVRWESNDFL